MERELPIEAFNSDGPLRLPLAISIEFASDPMGAARSQLFPLAAQPLDVFVRPSKSTPGVG
jgi:hypothetical protein